MPSAATRGDRQATRATELGPSERERPGSFIGGSLSRLEDSLTKRCGSCRKMRRAESARPGNHMGSTVYSGPVSTVGAVRPTASRLEPLISDDPAARRRP